MKLARDTVANKIEIKAPRWKQRVVGIATFRVGTHNEIEILATGKDGKRYYPETFYASGDQIKTCETQTLPSGVPISQLDLLERV